MSVGGTFLAPVAAVSREAIEQFDAALAIDP